jgi:hypothetical protein
MTQEDKDTFKIIPIRLSLAQHAWLEDYALKNRRAGNKNFSSTAAIIRELVKQYIGKI